MVRVLTFGLRADLMGGIEKFVFTMAGHMMNVLSTMCFLRPKHLLTKT